MTRKPGSTFQRFIVLPAAFFLVLCTAIWTFDLVASSISNIFDIIAEALRRHFEHGRYFDDYFDTATYYGGAEFESDAILIATLCVTAVLPIFFLTGAIIWLAVGVILPRIVDVCQEQKAARLQSCRADTHAAREPLLAFLWLIFLANLLLPLLDRITKAVEVDFTDLVTVQLREFVILRRVGSITAS